VFPRCSNKNKDFLVSCFLPRVKPRTKKKNTSKKERKIHNTRKKVRRKKERKKEKHDTHNTHYTHYTRKKMEGNIEEEEIPAGNTGLTHIVTDEEIMMLGLLTVKYDEEQLRRCGDKTNQYRFKVTFGVTPTTMCRIYEDLQTSTAEDTSTNPPRSMRLKGTLTNLKWYLRTVYYLRKYPTEDDIDRVLKMNKGWARTNIWDLIEKIQYLQFKKITWPDELGGEDIWIMTIDGTHVWLYEPGHEEFSQDSDYYSHKFNKAGMNYELGIAIASRKLIWMKGPYKAGKNDLQIFTGGGLKARLLQLKKKGIGDGGYSGHQEAISSPNTHDSRSVKLFKSRALKRHEGFNGMTKSFQILRERFRHGPGKIGRAFEAVAVICQYKIEAEEPLWDVLVEDVLKEDVEEDSDSDMEDIVTDGEDDEIEEDDEEDEDDDKRIEEDDDEE
jgi:hypothetical protein